VQKSQHTKADAITLSILKCRYQMLISLHPRQAKAWVPSRRMGVRDKCHSLMLATSTHDDPSQTRGMHSPVRHLPFGRRCDYSRAVQSVRVSRQLAVQGVGYPTNSV